MTIEEIDAAIDQAIPSAAGAISEALAAEIASWRVGFVGANAATGCALLPIFDKAVRDVLAPDPILKDNPSALAAVAAARREFAVLAGIPADAVPAVLYQAPEPAPLAGNIIQSSGQFVKGFEPPDYLFDGVLQRRYVYSKTGKTGVGKTTILLLFAASTALGRPIGTCAVEQGRVLYFVGENPDDVRMRWIALSQQMDFDVDHIAVHFIAGAFKISELLERIRSEVDALGGVALVIVDTSAAYFEGADENDNRQAGDHARRFRSLVALAGGPCVIVACHPTKNAADDNLIPRGGGAFVAEMDGNLTAQKDGAVVEMHWQGKFRGPDFAPISFMLRTVTHERLKDSRGRLIPTVVASHLSEAGQDELAAVARSHERQLLKVLGENGGASLADLARLLDWRMKNGEPHKMMVRRTLEKLKERKLVTADRVLTPKGVKAVEEGSALQ